jgi:hypothetical protein
MSEAAERDLRLEYRARLPVLGIDTEFQTNSRYIIGVAEEAFGVWGHADRRLVDPALRLTIRIIVHEGPEDGLAHAAVEHVLPDAHRFIARSLGSVGTSDPARRESTAYVTTTLAADRAHFRSAMFEALTFALLSQFDRHPLHAAAIACDGRAVLLAGESGAGKSTLAYVARSAGFDVLAEDHAWVQLEPELRIWGGASHVRLEPNAATRFPDAPGVVSTVAGKTKLIVDMPRSAGGLVATDAVVCLLARRAGEPALERVEASAIEAALTTRVSPGFDRFPDRHRRVARALAAPGGWRLRLSDDPRAALPLLETMARHRGGS